jgi:hypothetical protein
MDVFRVHEQVIADYRAFTSGFVEVRDKRIKAFVDQQFDDGVQWPDLWVGLNPSFATGGSVVELVRDGLLHPEAERIFRRKSDPQDAGRDPIVLHRHQRQAVEIAWTGVSYVLTTGTGSGKSLAYIIPIVDAVLRENAQRGSRRPGVKAMVVYPMNALANSQVEHDVVRKQDVGRIREDPAPLVRRLLAGVAGERDGLATLGIAELQELASSSTCGRPRTTTSQRPTPCGRQ